MYRRPGRRAHPPARTMRHPRGTDPGRCRSRAAPGRSTRRGTGRPRPRARRDREQDEPAGAERGVVAVAARARHRRQCEANGASDPGAGISRTRSSARATAARSASSAASNSGGSMRRGVGHADRLESRPRRTTPGTPRCTRRRSSRGHSWPRRGARAFGIAAVGDRAARRGRRRVAACHRRMARRVVTPPAPVPDTRILSLDTGGADDHARAHAATRGCRGRYGFCSPAGPGYVKLGAVLGEDDGVRKRKLDADRLRRLAARRTRRSAAGTTTARGAGTAVRERASSRPPSARRRRGSFRPRPATPVGDPGARPRRDPRRVPARRSGLPRARGHHAARLVPQRRRGAARARTGTTRSAPRSGAMSMRPSGSRDAAGRERIVLMGWSMGGAIALQPVLRLGATATRSRGSSWSRPSSTGATSSASRPGAADCRGELGARDRRAARTDRGRRP